MYVHVYITTATQQEEKNCFDLTTLLFWDFQWEKKIIDILCVILIFRMCIAFELKKNDGYFHSSGFEKNRLLLSLPWSILIDWLMDGWWWWSTGCWIFWILIWLAGGYVEGGWMNEWMNERDKKKNDNQKKSLIEREEKKDFLKKWNGKSIDTNVFVVCIIVEWRFESKGEIFFFMQ